MTATCRCSRGATEPARVWIVPDTLWLNDDRTVLWPSAGNPLNTVVTSTRAELIRAFWVLTPLSYHADYVAVWIVTDLINRGGKTAPRDQSLYNFCSRGMMREVSLKARAFPHHSKGKFNIRLNCADHLVVMHDRGWLLPDFARWNGTIIRYNCSDECRRLNNAAASATPEHSPLFKKFMLGHI